MKSDFVDSDLIKMCVCFFFPHHKTLNILIGTKANKKKAQTMARQMTKKCEGTPLEIQIQQSTTTDKKGET